jgi:hypothetical protein
LRAAYMLKALGVSAMAIPPIWFLSWFLIFLDPIECPLFGVGSNTPWWSIGDCARSALKKESVAGVGHSRDIEREVCRYLL